MKFSEQWLREWTNPAIDSATLMSRLTMAGLEVDGHEPVAADFSGVVIGEVLNVAPHPDAERLSVCEVSDGDATYTIVCGAPNVVAGMKVPLARVGASLPGETEDSPFVIREAKLRGIKSQGMLCAAEELGMAERSDGLMVLPGAAPLGENLRVWLGLDDLSIELDLTPNRGDCLGIAGLAREVAALCNVSVAEPTMPEVPASIQRSLPVHIEAPAACQRYLGRVIEDINPQAETPLWMQERLRRCGLRSIDPVVDVTNYVLLELGQPMHAFDLACIRGGIRVRMAAPGETLTLLDGQTLNLSLDNLVIADDERALALAGIMGGEESGVTDATRDVFLESACFAPLAIAGKARAHGLHTDSSHRFERGVDYELQHKAMARATALLLEIAGGKPGPVVAVSGKLPAPAVIDLHYASIERLLGMRIEADEVRDILERLGFVLVGEKLSSGEVRTLAGAQTSKAAAGLEFGVPSFRHDVSIEADLIEELARVYGYDRLPSRRGSSSLALGQSPEQELPLSRLRQVLVARGYQEAITYSFVAPELMRQLQPEPEPEPIALQNPISSDMAVMRTSLWAGLLSTLKYNLNRQQQRVRLFECGQVFLRGADGEVQQPACIAGLLYGPREPEGWLNGEGERVDFYDAKGDVEALLALAGNAAVSFSAVSHPALHPGQSAVLRLDGEVIGCLGSLHPALQRALDLAAPVMLFELRQLPLLTGRLPQFKRLSRYPEVSRDLAVVIDERVAVSEVMAVLQQQAGKHLEDLRILDVYQGEGIEKGKKSLALGLTWRHASRTLGEDDINEIFSNCVKGLEQTFNAKLR